MMLQLCAMPTTHYDNIVWVAMPTIWPKNLLPVVENGPFLAQRVHSARCARMHRTCIIS